MPAPALTTTSFDSASLSVLASIAHPMRQKGRWRLELKGRRGRPLGEMDIVVREGGKARIGVDLARPIPSGSGLEADQGVLAPNGMINLSTSTARDAGFAVLYSAGTGEPVWDSRSLDQGDHYACMPFRPGTYRIANLLSNTHSSVRVNYPDPRAIARGHRLASGAVHLQVRQAITPREHSIDPGQVLVFAIETRSHLAVELARADHGPADLVEWRAARNQDRLNAAFRAARRQG